jgi:GT2 family glycosyltransferase/tetratricopeptide (TPR) repeat protein
VGGIRRTSAKDAIKSRLGAEAAQPLIAPPTALAPISGAVAEPAEPAPCISIVIPHLSAPQLGPCLASIFEHGAERSFEVVVVFDGSPEEDVQQIQGQYEDIRSSVLAESGGFARACNTGARLARGRYLVFLNDDTTVTAGWLDRLANFVESDPQIAIAGPKLLYPDSDRIQHCGTVFNEERFGVHIWRHSPADFAAAGRPRYYRAITGACIMIERELFLRLGGFDARFHPTGGCEDTDLCFRALRCGRRVAYCPDSVVYHHEGASRGPVGGSRPDEIYNQKLLRQRWSKFLSPDIAEYDVLADIEADEATTWPWLPDVPAEILARQCTKLQIEKQRLTGERDALATERESDARHQAAVEFTLRGEIEKLRRGLARMERQVQQVEEGRRDAGAREAERLDAMRHECDAAIATAEKRERNRELERATATTKLQSEIATVRHESSALIRLARELIAASASDLAAARKPEAPPIALRRALWLRARRAGDRARDTKQWPAAARHYRRALARNPRDTAVWVQYGHALKEEGHLSEAEVAYRRALDGDPALADTHLQLGHVLKLQQKMPAARAAYLRAFALAPTLPYPLDELAGLGWSEAQLGHLRRLHYASDPTVLADDHQGAEERRRKPVPILAAATKSAFSQDARAKEIYQQLVASLDAASS